MGVSGVILHQIALMFLYIFAGWGLYKAGLVTKEGSKALVNLLLYVIFPCVIVKSFCMEKTPETVRMVVLSFAGAVLVLGIAMIIAGILFRRYPVDNFGAAFSNAGFMGIPLVSATMGTEAVAYVSAMTALLNVLQWTYGQRVLAGKEKAVSWTESLKSPIVAALGAGLVIFAFGIRLPSLLLEGMQTISGMNAPVAMIILGTYLGEQRIREIMSVPRAWLCSVVRLVLIPVITIAAMRLAFPGERMMADALLICAAAPVGSNVAVYAQRLGQDYSYAVKIVCLSTLLSIFTLPLAVLVNGL